MIEGFKDEPVPKIVLWRSDCGHSLETLPDSGVIAVIKSAWCEQRESLFKTLKYRAAYPLRPFDTLTAARDCASELVRWYNHEHSHSAIGFVTATQRHRHLDQDILDRRVALYERARQENPWRWKGQTRSWQRVDVVHLNPDHSEKKSVVLERGEQERKAA